MVNFGGRPRYFEEGLPPPKASSLAGSRRGLVALLRALRGRLGADRDRRVDLLELKIATVLGAVLDDVGQVLGVAGVAGTLDANTLIGVVAGAGNLEGLIEVASL